MNSIHIEIFTMKYFVNKYMASLFILVCFCTIVQAKDMNADSIPKKIIPQVQVKVNDLEDGSLLDSALVFAGAKKGYTNNLGIIEFDNVVPGSEVIVSLAGYYVQSKKAKSLVEIHLIRKEKQQAGSIINTGLYERPEDHFSGSATVISGVELRKINALNFTEALGYFDPSFRLSRSNNNGDDPNATPGIQLRGSTNFPAQATIVNSGSSTGNIQINPSGGDFIADNILNPNQPIVLVNGVQVSLQTALDMDINRIDKITLLKDAAASAAYGVRGGSGIILIQTKQPQRGDVRVTYSGQIQITTPDLSSYHLLNATDKLNLENANGLYAGSTSLYQSRLYQANKGINTNWLTIPLGKEGIGHKHSLNLEGGDDFMNFGLDFSYNDVEGVMKGSDRKNTNFGGYISARTKNISFSNYLSYSKTLEANSPYGNFADYTKQNPYWNPYDSVTGQNVKILDQYTLHMPSGDSIIHFYSPAYNGSIATRNTTQYSRLSNTTNVNWIIGNGFKLNGQVSLYKQQDQNDLFLPPGNTAYADFSPNLFFKRGQYTQTSSSFIDVEGNLRLNYTKRVGLHQFYGTLGASAMQTQSEASSIVLIGFTNDQLSNIAYGSAYSNTAPSTGKIVTRLAAGFGNFTYSYDNRYQLELSGSMDASSQFSSAHQEAGSYAAGASWNLHQERFFHPNKILDQLRIRGSIGTTGNQYFQSYLGRTSYDYYTDRQYISFGSNNGTRGIGLGAFLIGFGNDHLKSPQTLKQNIGVDAVLFQKRLSLRIEAYSQQSKDLVLPVSSPTSTGFLNYSYYDNLGGIKSSGLEFALNYNIVQNLRKSILWTIHINGIHNEDRITATSSYVDALNKLNDGTTMDQTMPQPKYIVGQSPGEIWAVPSLGIDPTTGKEKFLKADGTTTFTWDANDKVAAGDVSPKWQGTFGTSLSVKNISAGIYFNYQYGAKFYNQTLADYVENANLAYNVDSRANSNRWKQPGDIALYKAVSLNGLLTAPTYATTRFVQDNNFVNCSAIMVGYEIPQSIISRIRARQAKISFIANNVFMSGSMKAERGILYPFEHMYSFNLTTSF